MRVTGKILLMLSLLAAVPVGLAAQQHLTVDLTDTGGSQAVSPGDFVVDIINRVPNASYNIKVKIQQVEIPPFKIGDLGITPLAQATEAEAENADPCQSAMDMIHTALANATDEQEVKTAISDVLASSDFKKCGDTTPINQFIDFSTKKKIENLTLQKGEELVVEIERNDPIDGDGSTKKNWTFTFTTGPKGSWLVHYGFSFLRDHDRTYFAKEDKASPASAKADGDAAAATTYTITRKTDHSGLKAEPSVALSYVPAQFRNSDWFPAFTAGLGVDLNNPFVFFGGSLLVGDNVNVFVGAAVHREKRLNGKYHEGDPITENLSEDQLTDNVLKPALVFGVGFRFDGNPFKKASASEDKK